MTVKSVIDIDVNDAKFQRFAAKFEQYQTALAKTPNVWKNVSKESAAVAVQFERSTAALLAQNEVAREQLEEDKKRLGNLTLQEKLWQSMSKSSTTFASNVLSASKWLLKWGSLLGAGLIGGSLFGIDRLASRTSDARSSAAGLGLSIGQQRSFNLNFGRFFGGDASGFLGGVAGAGADISKQYVFAGLGVNPNQPTDQLAVATLKALRARALATPIDQLGLLQQNMHYGEIGVGVEDLRRLRSAKPQEFSAQLAQHGRDSAGLNIADDTALRWQNLNNQLTRAGEQISRTFVVGLAKAHIPEALSKLSDGFSKFLTVLLQSDMVKDALTNVTQWLNNFSGTISSPEFLGKVSQFTSDVGDLADTLHNILHPIDALRNNRGSTEGFKEYLDTVDKKYGLPAGTGRRVFQTESSGRMYGVPVSSRGAVGPMGFEPKTAQQYGIDPLNPYAAGDASGHYLADLEHKYKGDIVKALAAYNWGPRYLDDYLKSDKGKEPDWTRGLPQSVKNYLQSTAAVTIKFVDTPGGATPVVASQLAALQ